MCRKPEQLKTRFVVGDSARDETGGKPVQKKEQNCDCDCRGHDDKVEASERIKVAEAAISA